MSCEPFSSRLETCDDAALELVFFSAGGNLLGVEACQVRGSGMMPETPLATIESLLALSAAGASGVIRKRLSIKGEEYRDREISVESPVELVRINAASIFPLPPLLAARSTLPGLRAFAFFDSRVVPLIDLGSLLLIEGIEA